MEQSVGHRITCGNTLVLFWKQEIKIACIFMGGRLARAWQDIGKVKEKGSAKDNPLCSGLQIFHIFKQVMV